MSFLLPEARKITAALGSPFWYDDLSVMERELA